MSILVLCDENMTLDYVNFYMVIYKHLIQVAKDAKESKQNEIDEIRGKYRTLEEEHMRLQLEMSQLQRNRRSSPTLKVDVDTFQKAKLID